MYRDIYYEYTVDKTSKAKGFPRSNARLARHCGLGNHLRSHRVACIVILIMGQMCDS